MLRGPQEEPVGRYVTLDEMKLVMRSPENPEAVSFLDGTLDDDLLRLLDTAEEEADAYCGRTFTPPAAEEVRSYPVHTGGLVLTDDVATSQGMRVATDTGQQLQFMAGWNWYTGAGPNARRPGRNLTVYGCGPGPVTVTARYGWPNGPPSAVKSAVMLRVNRLFARQSTAALGVVTADLAVPVYLPRVDADWQQLLAPYCGPGRY